MHPTSRTPAPTAAQPQPPPPSQSQPQPQPPSQSQPQPQPGRAGGAPFQALLSGRRLALTLATLAAGLSLMGWLIWQIDRAALVAIVERADLPLLALALALFISMTLQRAFRLRVFFPGKAPFVRFWGALALYRVLTYVLPFRMGEVVILPVLRRFGVSGSALEAAPVWFVLRLADMVAIIGVAVAVATLNPGRTGLPEAPLVSVVAIALLVLGGWCLLPPLARRAAGWLAARRRGGRLASLLDRLQQGVARLTLSRHLAGMLLAGVLMVSAVGMAAMTVKALLPDLPWTVALLAGAMGFIGTLMPLRPPLGIGVEDAIWVGAMLLAGIAREQAVVVALGVRLIQILVVIIDLAIAGLIIAAQRRQLAADQGGRAP